MISKLLQVVGAASLLGPLRNRESPCVSAAVIVAHPDDEVLWAGGEILSHPRRNWYILSLCRRNDPDRAQRFWRSLNHLNAMGYIADLDDGPDQRPLAQADVEHAILTALPEVDFDLMITHSPAGEYTRHRRHEEVSRAVISLWRSGQISTKTLMLFAYDDGDRTRFPRAQRSAHVRNILPKKLWKQKYQAIIQIYGFAPDSWEALATPREEAFWYFDSPHFMETWLQEQGLES